MHPRKRLSFLDADRLRVDITGKENAIGCSFRFTPGDAARLSAGDQKKSPENKKEAKNQPW